MASFAASQVAKPTALRDFYVDRLRVAMTVLVILHHTAITYGAVGGWFWREIPPSKSPSSLLLILFCTTNQAYFMGFFFMLAGYFTPASLERKGYGRFVLDRFLRLGLPLLAFILILGPVTAAIVTAMEGDGFWPTIFSLANRLRIINGPLWFAEALLIFSLAYCGWRAIFGVKLPGVGRRAKPVPAFGWWLLSAIATGAGALAIRQFVPVGVNIFGLQLGYFSMYIFLFGLGIAAWRYDWLRQLTWKQARPWVIGLLLTWPVMPLSIVLADKLNGPGKSNFGGGFSWPAIVYALWEPFLAWGLIALWLLVFRERLNKPSEFWDWLGRRAYAVYIIHPPVLVLICMALRGWHAPALVKFGAVGAVVCVACWLLADPLVRLPGLRRVV
jgi:peptidoglycan/LPS O-acetylase OafA/YrhL